MANYINPFTDIGFKRIFGQEFSKPLLIDFLNNLLIGEKRIVDLNNFMVYVCKSTQMFRGNSITLPAV